jgi:hypothetical protein
VRLAFTIDRGAGSELVTITPAGIIAWERENGTKLSRVFRDGLGVGDMAALVYAQLRLDGKPVPDTLDAFGRELRDIDLPGDSDAGDPT